MFEEVKEMIDSTVYTNGNGEVTAQNINLAMQGIVEATEEKITEVENKVAEIEENGTGGSGALKVWVSEFGPLTSEQIAENVETYNTLLGGEHVPVIVCSDYEESLPEHEYFARYTFTAPLRISVTDIKYPDGNVQAVQLFLSDTESIGLNPDGTVEFFSEVEPSTPASSGPLTFYIGYLTTLSAEERITAEQKEHNATMFEIYKSSPYALGVFVDQSEMFTASMGMSGRAIKTSLPYQAQYFPVETGAEAIFLKERLTNNDEIGIVILPDGSVYRANELE